MATRIRTLDFLPEIFQTTTNSQFLAATLDQIVQQPETKRIEGYIGSKLGYGINAKDYYVTEPTKIRTDYQLDPGVVFTKRNESVAQDFISYPGILDALKLEGGLTNNNNRLFNSQFYSWDSFTNLDKVINFNQYYWIPEGPASVVVSSETVFSSNDYVVTSLPNAYSITPITSAPGTGSNNPTLTLLRGGTYNFAVNQDTQFWIQGTPGVTGFSPTQPNLQTRDVYGVVNNGANQGVVTFVVPSKDAQDNYNFPGNNLVDVVSTVPFAQVNGALVGSINIDGVTELEGLTVMFYNTGSPYEVGYVSNFFDYTPFGENNDLTSLQTISISSTNSATDAITCSSTSGLTVGNAIIFDGTPFGGLASYSPSLPNTIYFVESIINSTQFTVTLTPGGSVYPLSTDTGTMTGIINQGQFEQGYDTTVADNFYTIQYVGSPGSQVIRLVEANAIPIEEKITAVYGTQWIQRNFYKDSFGAIILIPYISAPLDTLYYQDGTSSNKVGIIKIIESNETNTLNVVNDILGKKTFTATNGVVFTNGLKITFQGDVIPTSYLTGEYYVEGVGTAIELLPVENFVVPEDFTASTYDPWDVLPWDAAAWEGNSFIPVTPDYITIARNSIDKNAWSRSNRWFHIDVINATANYNNNQDLITLYTNSNYKAKRPIIEFYPNLKLFNSGTEGKSPVDFIDTRTSDAFSLVAGQQNYYPDIEVYTDYTATIASVNYTPDRFITTGSNTTGIFTTAGGYNTTGMQVNDLIVFDNITPGSGITPGGSYYVQDVISSTQFKISANKNGSVLIPNVAVSGSYEFTWSPQSTTITIAASDVLAGTFTVGQYVSDSTNVLPRNSQIVSITGTTTLTLTLDWDDAGNYFSAQTDSSIVGSDTTVDNYALFDGATVIFTADTDPNVKNKIYMSQLSVLNGSSIPVITLTEIDGGDILPNNQTVAIRGYYNQGNEFWFDGINWIEGQQKTDVNQPPLFDIFDDNDISFGDTSVYVGTSFAGCKLFAYGIGAGIDDSILGFPLRYSSVDNVGDISFDVSLNADTFDYVIGNSPITQKVNTGYVFNYIDRTTKQRNLGWQTAIASSVQYQVFQFNYTPNVTGSVFTCDVASVTPFVQDQWPGIEVYINNRLLTPTEDYTWNIGPTSTTITILEEPILETVIQILILSNQISATAYYTIPINLNNNPLNADITVANVGDIRGQYQSMFFNNIQSTGEVFGPNNFRDLGNMVPYGNKIIQNSASLALPGAFLRKPEHNLFNALMYNSREYVKFKNLLAYTVDNSNYEQRYNASVMLDDALDQITAAKSDSQPFFWSDMLPGKAAYKTNTYSFANSLDVSIYPLDRIYDFSTANYYGVLVYLTRTTAGVTVTQQLTKNIDYTISTSSPSLTVTLDLLPGDKITIKEYNQTYGSYVPNTPTKLGLYPAYVPQIILDSNYNNPTYFIKGHDGSYTKLYGEYDSVTGYFSDFRDQVLLEFELRIYNNLKLSSPIPIQEYEIVPGFFRQSSTEIKYSYDEWLYMYSTNFLDWTGQNRLDYKPQLYNKNNDFTWNYRDSGNNLNGQPIKQGYWRGIYEYFYDTTTPEATPWEMIGYTEKPIWWENRYGPAPYTSDNIILWTDMSDGYDYNDGDSFVNTLYARPGLLNIIPVNSAGELLSPMDVLIGNYNERLFQRDWKVGDDAPVELSYRRSSSYPFDLVRLMALMQPAKFYNLAVDLDNYKYNEEFNQYLVNNRSHLRINEIEIYGSGTAKTSYINWIVDYEKQIGLDATTNIETLLDNVDVRLVYRLAGFSDKTLLKFYVEKGTPNSRNASLLIPDESYSVLLYDNQPFNKIIYSGIIIQIADDNTYLIYGNSQTSAYFKTLKPKFAGTYKNYDVEGLKVRVTPDHFDSEQVIPYGAKFYSAQEVAQFISDYSAYLVAAGMKFEDQENELVIDWNQMTIEFLYWAQTGWQPGSLVTLNPAAKRLTINKDSNIVQPLTIQQTNFVLNQNLYPIQTKDLAIVREGVAFNVAALNAGDTIAYGQFNLSNFEHGIVFDNITLFGDIIYNLTTGLRQTRIVLRGTKSAAWDGTVNASGFVYNQDNIKEWNRQTKYTKGEIVTYKNKYWIATKIIQPSELFKEADWVRTDYDEVQKGLLPNASTRSYESTLYYDIDKANLEIDADQLSFSLIGYRPRDYMALADLTDITQVNVYRNLIKNKGTRNAVSAFKGANLPQGGIDYDVYENWAIKSGEFGGVLNNNFVEFKVNEKYLTGNPAVFGLTNGQTYPGTQQEIPLSSVYNYGRPITDVNVLSTVPVDEPTMLYPDAGYVNFNDVKMSAFFYSQLPIAVNKNNLIQPIDTFYVRDYAWVANFKERWEVFTPSSLGQIILAQNNLNETITITFNQPHNLSQYDPFAIVNFDTNINGYYIAVIIVDPYRIIVNKNLDPSIKVITGQGIALQLTSQRVATPADITSLPLLNSEFTKNTVWVDTDTDGSWGVYRKNLNYSFNTQFTKATSQNLGNAVKIIGNTGYLIADSEDAKVYRYTYNELSQGYDLIQTITGTGNFGYAIDNASDIYGVISKSTNLLKLYQLQNTTASDDLILIQTISVTNPDNVIFSGDQKWLFVGIPDSDTVKVYKQDYIPTASGNFVSGQTYEITSVGTTDFTTIGAVSNDVGVKFEASGSGTGTGTATQITYTLTNTIDGVSLGLVSSGDRFGASISTDYYGDCLFIGAPNKDFNSLDNWGYAYIFDRVSQNIEIQYNSISPAVQTLQLAWTPTTLQKTVSATSAPNTITLNNTTGLTVNDPIIFTTSGTGLSGTNIDSNVVYYINSIVGSTITIKTSRSAASAYTITTNASVTATAHVQTESIFVSKNGSLVTDNNYAVVNDSLIYTGTLTAGDIITINGRLFTLAQTLTTQESPQIGSQFGFSLDTNTYGSELLIGAPFQLNTQFEEGTVYRYTDGGAKYGSIVGTSDCNVTSVGKLLINGYLVYIPIGNAATVANAIASSQITNITATSLNGKLIISLINQSLAQTNEKLVLSVVDSTLLAQLGIELYTQTQEILCPHLLGPTQFGTVVKFNELDSVVISAPVGTRYMATTFDFIDDENQDNDTLFDNNATQWIDQSPNYGAVYMFDYVPQYNESLSNVGNFIYAQSVNSTNLVYTPFNTYNQTTDITYNNQPRYGTALDFNRYGVIIGTPNDTGATTGFEYAGSATTYQNTTGIKDWSLYRYSAPIVDINRINNSQLFSAETNNTLINLDYIDPLQGKILGAARENIDIVSNTDPASYNNALDLPGSLVWGAAQIGTVWLDTTNMRYVNYHQNDNVAYNAQYWGTLFPGSDVAVYSWIESTVLPLDYQGPGIPYAVDNYSTQYVINAAGALVPIYYFWVRDTNTIFTNNQKTLADSVVASYIENPKTSGVSYMAPILPNVFALYNSGEYINANDSVFHVGYATGTNDDVSHQQFNLIRSGYPDDFLPGVPIVSSGIPDSLYDRMLDSMCGVDETGSVVPNPYLPKAVQSGVLARPRQSFFYNRFIALKNYLQYANSVLAQYPITEIRQNLSFLYTKNPEIVETIFAGNCQEGTVYTIVTVGDVDWTSIGAPSNEIGIEFTATGPATGIYRNTGTASFVAFGEGVKYDTTDYWEFVNWWATGYDNNTKSAYQVAQYADLSALNVAQGTIVRVTTNDSLRAETYVYESTGLWRRIGLERGTIAFKSSLWDYESVRLGFGDNFYDTAPYDVYPSEETRNIIRALNEQIYTEDLLVFRNRSLILLFEYIQSETTENQNYLPWLNKTSFIDVAHTIRELRPIQVFQSDNQEFLEGYIREVKPYHVVIKEFLFKYTGEEIYAGDITDFDLPAKYNTSVNEFVSPQLVYSSPSAVNQYLPSDPIWQDPEYVQWFENHGLTIGIPSTVDGRTTYVGEKGYQLTTLATYISLNSSSFAVDNAQGFPINGVIYINGEKIAYSSVDRALNVISGLTRGVDGTPITTHLPGALINMDLPAIILLDGGRGYTEPPKVTAYVDTTIYPAPTKSAVLSVVMSLDSVSSITVTDPGQGYPILPTIEIDPAIVVPFSSGDVNTNSNTITVYAPLLQTGDLVQYKVDSNTTEVGGLENGQWYYVNVLETVPTAIVGLYANYSNAINNHDRLPLYTSGSGTGNTLNLGARASAVTSALPVRENDITLRFDRTTYNSRLIDWIAGNYYGAYYAGQYSNSETVSSSSISLQSTQPPIDSILASAQGVAFEITNVRNDRTINYSSFVRVVDSTIAANDSIRLTLQDDGSGNPNASGGTLGFYIGMPVKFAGATLGNFLTTATNTTTGSNVITLSSTTNLQVNDIIVFTGATFGGLIANQIYYVLSVNSGTNAITISTELGGSVFSLSTSSGSCTVSFGGIRSDVVYYVESIVNQTDFKISTTTGGNAINLSNASPVATLSCYVGEVNDVAIVTVNYPGILSVTNTTALTNAVTVPLNVTGTGGTNNFYIGLPIFFTGTVPTATNNGVFGGVVENQPYFVTTVIDDETFTFSDNAEPQTFSVTSTVAANDTVVIDGDTSQLEVNQPIIFNNMIVAGTQTTSFGNLISGTLYYISSIEGPSSFTVSTSINGSILALSNVAAASNTSALLTDQSETITLSTVDATTSENYGMVVNVNLPVSPGQVDGQLFTLYETSGQYPQLVGTNGDLISRNLAALIGNKYSFNANELLENYEYEITFVGTTDFTLLGAASNTIGIRFIANATGTGTGTGTVTQVVNRVVLTNYISGVSVALGLTNIYDNMPLEISETIGSSFLSAGTTYYVVDTGTIEVDVVSTSSTGNLLTCENTASLFADMPILFSGSGVGGVEIDVEYWVKEVVDEEHFTITNTPGGLELAISNGSGLMTGTGLPYLKVSTSTGGTDIDPGNTQQNATISVASPAVVTVTSAPDNLTKIIFRNGTVPSGVALDTTYYVRNSAGTTFNLSLTPTGSLINSTGSSGSTTMVVTEEVTIDQTPIINAEFDVSYILGGYRVIITDPGEGYAVDNTITISGVLLGGTSPTNDLTLTVNSIDTFGEILEVICAGTVPGNSNQYYLKVISPNEFAVFSNSLMTVPVSGLTLPYVGITETTVNNINSGTEELTLDDASGFDVNDAVVFTGDLTPTIGVLTEGQTYYITAISGNDITISSTPAGSNINFTTTIVADFTIAKSGSFALLPEPFYFNQSIVKYNNKVWLCIISNNDQEFVFGKWQELLSGDRRLNALDRVRGYYAPTDNMPGIDLSQLFEGVTYPNSIYLGNAFAPDQQYPIDTILQDQQFYPTDVDVKAVSWDGVSYLAAANMPTYSSVISSTAGSDWEILKLANSPLSTTDIIYSNNLYIVTTKNNATPIYRSADGVTWTTNGYYTPYSATPYDETNYDMTALSVASLSLNSVAHSSTISVNNLISGYRYQIMSLGNTDWNIVANTTGVIYAPDDVITANTVGSGTGTVQIFNDGWVAVGQNIVSSYDTYIWRSRFEFSNPLLSNEFFGIDYINITSFRGFIAVGKGQQIEYSTGIGVTINTNVLVQSLNGITWIETPYFSTKGLYGITDNGSIAVAVGEDGVIYITSNGTNWLGINRTNVVSSNGSTDVLNLGNTSGLVANDTVRFNKNFDTISSGTTYYVAEIISGTQIRLSPDASDTLATLIVASEIYRITSLGTTDWNVVAGTVAVTYSVGDVITAVSVGTGTGTARQIVDLTGSAIPIQTELFIYPETTDLNDIAFGNSTFIAVGDSGLIKTSSNGISWTIRTSGTTENLNGVHYNTDDNTWIAVGENNTILISIDAGLNWTSSSVFAPENTIYDVQGAEFTFGYGPEELVPGVVTDNVMMTIATRPGTDWDATEYAHVGYNVVSIELSPTSGTQTIYSFDVGQQFDIQNPAQIAVYIINGTTNVATAIYNTIDYTINWINFTVTLNVALPYTPVPDKLRIDIYEVGNGSQLVKSSTKSDPIRYNETTGWNEIYVNCNYTGEIYQGSGVVRPNTFPVDTEATETSSINNTILLTDVSNLVLNEPISFQGAVFGGIVEDTIYYVKTISSINNTITISATYNVSTQTAGPVFVLSDATGYMTVIIKTGFGNTWTPPIIYHNGIKLLPGYTQTVTRTKASNNGITCSSTNGLVVGDTVTFSDTMFGPDITPQTVYFIQSIIDGNEFTISTTLGGPVLPLTNATGGAEFISNDYSFGIQPNGTSASIIFSVGDYDPDLDYITYTLFGETTPTQYGYTIPEVQLITGDGTVGPYTLNNFVGDANPDNAIVEVNGVRLLPSDYTIDFNLNEITFVGAIANGDQIAVTTYNLTDRQYFSTQFGTANTDPGYVNVSPISNINNTIAPFDASTNCTNTTTGTNVITCTSTNNFVVGQTVIFKGTSFGGVATDGTVYYINSVPTPTTFTIEDENGAIIPLSTASGLVIAYVGGLPAVRVTTSSAHGLTTNDVVRIDGTTGSVQLNNNTYYVHVINSTQVDLYSATYDSSVGAVNQPVTAVSTYINGGFIWIADSYTLVTTQISDTTTDPILGNYLTVASGNTNMLVVGTPIIFTGSVFGGVVGGTTYYIKEIISITEFSISATRDGEEFILSTASGTMAVTQWEQDNVDRLWVTVNGYRVPSSSLRLNADNQVSILCEIVAGDNVIITSMMPSATPNEMVYLNAVNVTNQGTVYRANTQTRTWLTESLSNTQDIIHVRDVTRLTDIVEQSVTTPAAVSGVYSIGITADKNLISNVTVYNVTTGSIISNSNYEIVVESLAPILKITAGAYITVGDVLLITILEGNLIFIDGEQIKFTSVDLANNTISGLQRGTNGTGEKQYYPKYTEVYGLLSQNRMTNVDYSETWNSYNYNDVEGDPLQISDTEPAIFLRGDVN